MFKQDLTLLIFFKALKDDPAWLETEGVDCEKRMIRGGSWNGVPDALRSSLRNGFATGYRANGLGFRLVQGIP